MLSKTLHRALGSPNLAKHGYVLQALVRFLSPDTEALKKDLNLEDQAVIRGRQNLPRTDVTGLDEIERSVIACIDRFKKEAAEQYDAEMKTYAVRLSTRAFLARAADIGDAARKAQSDFEETFSHAQVELNQLRTERERAADDLKAFRQHHRLTREADLPLWPAYLSWALLAFIFAVEWVVNGVFFSERLAGGLSQGFVEAAVFAFINVICGYIAGRIAVPRAGHENGLTKLFGIGLLLIMVAVILMNNLAAAHYRTVLLGDVDLERATAIAWDRFWSDPLGIGDLKSALLLGLGCLAAFLAAWKAWGMDEPYPGFGIKTRKVQAKVDEFIMAKKARLGDITAARDAASGIMRASLVALEGSVGEHRTIVDVRRSFHHAFCTHLDELETIANDLLTAYRQRNTEMRRTPAPAHFKDRVVLERPAMVEPSASPEEIQHLDELVQSVAKDLSKRQDTLHDAYDDALRRLIAIE